VFVTVNVVVLAATGNGGTSSSGWWEYATVSGATSKPAYVVLRQIGRDKWQVIGEVERKPGLSARNARAQAIEDATGGRAKAGQVYRAVLRSEWRISGE
jgi:hypothetical protein